MSEAVIKSKVMQFKKHLAIQRYADSTIRSHSNCLTNTTHSQEPNKKAPSGNPKGALVYVKEMLNRI